MGMQNVLQVVKRFHGYQKWVRYTSVTVNRGIARGIED